MTLPTLLIGFAEALPAPEVVFSLHHAGYPLRVFARKGGDGTRALKGLPVGEVLEITAPEDSLAAAVTDLEAHLSAGLCDAIFPLDDVALALMGQCDPKGRIVIGATGAQADLALDKRLQIDAASAAGLAVPATQVLESPNATITPLEGPAILKPALAVDLRGGRVAKDRFSFFDPGETTLPEITPPMLFQPLIQGQGRGIFGFATATGVTGWSGHRRVRMMNPHGSGASASASVTPPEDLRHAISAMMQATGWRGAFMIELLYGTDGTPWFMELNGRMWGSMALARRGGFDYPAWTVAQAFDPEFQPPHAPGGDHEVRHLGREILHLLHVLRGPRADSYRAGWPKLLPTLGTVLRPGAGQGFYNYDPAFPRFFLQDALRTVKRGLKR